MNHKITAFIIAEARREKRGREIPPLTARSAPHYFEKTIPSQFILGQKINEIEGVSVEFMVKTYHPYAILVSGSFFVKDIFKEENVLDLKNKVHEFCYELAKKYGGKEEIAEEYAIYQVAGYQGDPELFLSSFGQKIASLLKSETTVLDDKEVEYTLSHQIKYSEDDLVIIDWDGAFIFDPKGEVGEIVEIMELANYQLLRYRLLDASLDEQMQKTSEAIEGEPQKKGFFYQKEFREEFLRVIRTRAGAIAKFEALERDIKLIGEWYSARLYELISKKFRLTEWRQSIQGKIDSLENIYEIVTEKLSMSRVQRLEMAQIFGFFLLQIGWFILIILEFINITEK